MTSSFLPLQPVGQEYAFYESMFRIALGVGSTSEVSCSRLGGRAAVDFFLKSGLGRSELREIWSVVDSNGTGSIDFHQFTQSLKMIALVQESSGNFEREHILIEMQKKQSFPHPRFEGITLPSNVRYASAGFISLKTQGSTNRIEKDRVDDGGTITGNGDNTSEDDDDEFGDFENADSKANEASITEDEEFGGFQSGDPNVNVKAGDKSEDGTFFQTAFAGALPANTERPLTLAPLSLKGSVRTLASHSSHSSLRDIVSRSQPTASPSHSATSSFGEFVSASHSTAAPPTLASSGKGSKLNLSPLYNKACTPSHEANTPSGEVQVPSSEVDTAPTFDWTFSSPDPTLALTSSPAVSLKDVSLSAMPSSISPGSTPTALLNSTALIDLFSLYEQKISLALFDIVQKRAVTEGAF